MSDGLETSTVNGKPMRRAFSGSDAFGEDKAGLGSPKYQTGHFRKPTSRRTLAPFDLSRLVTPENLRTETNASNLKASPGKMKLERALQLRDQCDRELRTICESKRRRYRPLSTFDSHDELVLLEQDRTNESVIRDRRELERLMRKLSPAMSHFASTEAEFVHILQGCSTCSNRLAFCGPCTEKASEFFNGFTSAELFALYGNDLPPANETELANFIDAVTARETRAIRNGNLDN